jgi:hypothetical protein
VVAVKATMLHFCPGVFLSWERGQRPDDDRVLYPVAVRLAKRLEELQVDGQIWDLLLRYGWQEAKRAAFVAPAYRMMVERDLLKGVK